jgi:hypothetical protein
LPTYKCNGCLLDADPTFDCIKDPVEIHAARWCTNTPWTGTGKLFERKGVPQGSKVAPGTFVGGVSAGDTALRVYAEIGSIKSFNIGAWAYLGPSIAAFVDPTIAEHRICGLMIDGAGSMCIACADVKCCSCDNPPVAFSIASYDSTIDPGGSAYVTVTGGCGPYSYSVSGTGYTASGTGTVGTISSASGACGTDYTPTVTVTAKDVCGTEKTCVIRNTGGHWGAICTYDVGAPCGFGTCIPAGCAVGYTDTRYVDDYKWTYDTYDCRQNSDSCPWDGTGPGGCVTLGYGSYKPAICPNYAHDCDNGQGCNGGCSCIPTHTTRWNWIC